MDTTIVEAIPYPAWQQAVFVALFIVLVVSLLIWFTRQQSAWQKFVQKINDSWQQTVKENNASWQTWLAEQNARECDSMGKVTLSLDRLTEKLAEHDGKVEDRFRDAIQAVTANKSRPRKTDGVK
jgi:hypothetical protein